MIPNNEPTKSRVGRALIFALRPTFEMSGNGGDVARPTGLIFVKY